MSSTQQLPTPEQAYDTLLSQVHQRVFFNKLAAYGFAPMNEQQAVSALQIAAKLRAVEEARIKQAQVNSANDPFAQANSYLDSLLQAHGLNNISKQAHLQNETAAAKQAAAILAQDPLIYNSVLSMKAAEAAEVQAALQANN